MLYSHRRVCSEKVLTLKTSELKLLSELMKDSRRSDRELAKAVGVSQPTVSRIIKKLKKEDIIKECTVIPDFHKLGFEILAITFLAVEKESDSQQFEETFQNVLMIERGSGLKYSHVVVSLHEDYSSYADFERRLKKNGFSTVKDSASFLVNLNDAQGLFSFSALAELLMKSGQEQKS